MTAVPTVVDESPMPVETNSAGSNDDLPDPYEDRRRQLEESKLHEQRAIAIKVFVRRMKVVCSVQLVLAILLVISRYWYAHAVNLVMGAMGLYGAFKLKNEFLFVHIILLGLTAVKNVGLMYLQISTRESSYEAFLIAVLFIDTLIVAPSALYLSYWLYQSLGTELTGVRFASDDDTSNGYSSGSIDPIKNRYLGGSGGGSSKKHLDGYSSHRQRAAPPLSALEPSEHAIRVGGNGAANADALTVAATKDDPASSAAP